MFTQNLNISRSDDIYVHVMDGDCSNSWRAGRRNDSALQDKEVNPNATKGRRR
jgi:hypothetical protein